MGSRNQIRINQNERINGSVVYEAHNEGSSEPFITLKNTIDSI